MATNSANASSIAEKANKYRYTSEIQAMMYTFGDIRNPLTETAQLVEEIVHSQIVETIVQSATLVVAKRGTRNLSAEDFMFLIRHDHARSSRLKEFLSWKDVRKNAKPSDDAGSVLVEVSADIDDAAGGGSAKKGANGSTVAAAAVAPGMAPTGIRRKNVRLTWDFVSNLTTGIGNGADDEPLEEESDPLTISESLQRLNDADLITRAMTKEEYMEYSECRQASFTYKKSKKFRDWINSALHVEFRLGDDVVEILGFLAFEMVQKLTEVGLVVQRDEAQTKIKRHRAATNCTAAAAASKNAANGTGGNAAASNGSALFPSAGDNGSGTNDHQTSGDALKGHTLKRLQIYGLFTAPSEKTPLLPTHIHEAFRRLQMVILPVKNFCGGLIRRKPRLI